MRLFDIYRGEQIGAGKKSLAYRLTYQAPDKTMTDAEAAAIRNKIVQQAGAGTGRHASQLRSLRARSGLLRLVVRRSRVLPRKQLKYNRVIISRKENHKIMDNRTKSLIATGAAVILCGCPGLFLCIFGGLAATGAPVTTTGFSGVSNTGPMSSTSAFVLLCLGVIFILIPIAVGFFTLRKKPGAGITGDPTVPPAA